MKRSITQLMMAAVRGVSVEYEDTNGLQTVRVFYTFGNRTARPPLFSVEISDVEPLYEAWHIPAHVEAESRSDANGVDVQVVDQCQVNQWDQLQRECKGAKGAEALKEFVTPKRLAWALNELIAEDGLPVLAEVLSQTTE